MLGRQSLELGYRSRQSLEAQRQRRTSLSSRHAPPARLHTPAQRPHQPMSHKAAWDEVHAVPLTEPAAQLRVQPQQGRAGVPSGGAGARAQSSAAASSVLGGSLRGDHSSSTIGRVALPGLAAGVMRCRLAARIQPERECSAELLALLPLLLSPLLLLLLLLCAVAAGVSGAAGQVHRCSLATWPPGHLASTVHACLRKHRDLQA